MQIFLFLWVSLGHPITVCFAELTFTSLIRISALNPKSRHYVTVATPRAVPGRRAKAFIWRTVVPLARVTLPAEVRQLAHPSCLAPRDEFAFLEETVGWILERNKLNVSSARITRGEGCLGYPRPYKWGVRGFVEKLCLHTEISCEPLGDKGFGNLLTPNFDRKNFFSPLGHFTNFPLVTRKFCYLLGKLRKLIWFVTFFVYLNDEIPALFFQTGSPAHSQNSRLSEKSFVYTLTLLTGDREQNVSRPRPLVAIKERRDCKQPGVCDKQIKI